MVLHHSKAASCPRLPARYDQAFGEMIINLFKEILEFFSYRPCLNSELPCDILESGVYLGSQHFFFFFRCFCLIVKFESSKPFVVVPSAIDYNSHDNLIISFLEITI